MSPQDRTYPSGVTASTRHPELLPLLWSLGWRASVAITAAKRALVADATDPGWHRFIDRRCLCGHQTVDDPIACPLFTPAAPDITHAVKRMARDIVAAAGGDA